MKAIITSTICIMLTSVLIISCSGGDMSKDKVVYSKFDEIPTDKLEKLNNLKILFGHQSVGKNIMDGVNDIILNNKQLNLEIIKTREKANIKNGVFAHTFIGENEKPTTKIDDFYALVNEELGNNIDLAFFKFCYVDIDGATDIDRLFEEYKNKIGQLQNKFPKTKILHVTAPLRVIQTGPKAWIKKIIGRPIGEYAENIKRNKYNDLIKNEYDERSVFDLAKVESTLPNGQKQTFKYKEVEYSTIVKEYTTDGRHLNEIGRKKAAQELLLVLVNNID